MVAAVSFVIPAYRSSVTLGRTLESLRRQTSRDWEAIIVDDGSDDRTALVARNWAARDPRFKLIEAAHGGASKARNRGILDTTGGWIVFLDADDTISPHFLKKMRRVAQRKARQGNPVDVVACGYNRVNEAGQISARIDPLPLDQNPVLVCASGPPGAIHSFLVRRDCVLTAGCFDETLVTNEDWDLWLRVASAGARFATTRQRLVSYWSTPNSLSQGGIRMLSDSRVVMTRARLLRVKTQRALHAYDHSRHTTDDIILRNAFWSAGVAIGRGASALDLISQVPPKAAIGGQKTHLIEKLMDGLVVGASVPTHKLARRWETMRAPIDAFIDAVVVHTGRDHDANALKTQVRGLLSRHARSPSVIDMGNVVALALTPAVLLRGYTSPPGVDVVLFRIPWLRPASFFSYVAPAFGRFTFADFAKTIFRGFWRRLSLWLTADEGRLDFADRLWRCGALARRALRLRRAEPPGFPLASTLRVLRDTRTSDIQRELSALDTPRAPPPIMATTEHPGTGADAAHWDAFFQVEDPWDYASDYEQLKYRRTLELLPLGKSTRALELACAEGRFTAMLAAAVGSLHAVDISNKAIERARARTAQHDNVTFGQHDLFADPITGSYDVITCSEVLYFVPSLERLAALAGDIAAALAPGGHFAHAHAYELVDDPHRTAFDWDDTVGAGGIHAAFAREPRLAHVRTVETDLYRVDLFRRIAPGAPRPEAIVERVPIGAPIEPAVAASIVWNGALQTRGALAARRAYQLPILQFDGVPMNELERHLRFLRRRGFGSVTPDELERSAARAGSLRGRPLLITGNYRNNGWIDEALPVILRNGFSLHSFVGLTPTPDWERLIGQVAKGMTVGSALCSDRPADDMTSADLLDEALRSRLILEHVLRVPVTTISPPFGQSDTRVEQILAGAGYHRLFVRDARIARVSGMEMAMPIITIGSGWSSDRLHSELPADVEAPDSGDTAEDAGEQAA